MALSAEAVRLLKTIEDGHSVTGIRKDIYAEVAGLIAKAPPCLQHAVLTDAGRDALRSLPTGGVER